MSKVVKKLFEKFQNLVIFILKRGEWRGRKVIDNFRLKFVKVQYEMDFIYIYYFIYNI